ncbi:MAG: aminopeptidase P family protein [Lentisphaerae bacterium]|nr:aminopeptidase P family protein [Lentisphaerota bacterium]
MKNFIRLLVGSGENCPDIRYATGISTPDDFIFFEYRDRKCAILSPLEIDRARSTAKNGVEIAAESSFGKSLIDIITAISGQCGCCDFLVPSDFPLGLADRMRSKNLTVTPDEKSFFPEREFKLPAEVAAITDAQRAAEAGLARAVEVLKNSEINGEFLVYNGEFLTSEFLRAEIDSAILFRNMLPTGTICASGSQGSQPHNAGSGRIRANSPIVMDIFPRSPVTGYWGDLTRTVVRGHAADIVRRAYDAVLEAREYAKTLIKKGAYGASIHCAVEGILEKHHFFTGVNDAGQFGFFHGLGHGVGLEIHESPRLSPRAGTALQGGEVVTVEPGLYYPEWGGIRLEDLMYLDPDGQAHCLTQAPDFLEII